MNQKLQKFHQHTFCKHSVKVLPGILKFIFLKMTQKALASFRPKGNSIAATSL